MENHQKINCSVESCMYNGHKTQECLLKDITVKNCNTSCASTPEDSMCGSYRCNKQ